MRTTYQLPTGKRFVLAYLELDEWARAMELALIHVGCSPEYAHQSADLIRQAVRV